MKPVFFPNAAEFRRWLEANHASAKELYVGFNKKSSGLGGMTYQEAVLEALCFGWIDSVIGPIDELRYRQRYTPRRKGSTWSLVNVAHVERLTASGKMAPAGLAAFAARERGKLGTYSFEQKTEAKLPPALARRFRENPSAWEFFQAQPRWYRHQVTYGIITAKREETRQRRLARVIAASARRERIN